MQGGKELACVAVVKSALLYQKTAVQHGADLLMIREMALTGSLPNLTSTFFKKVNGRLVPKDKVVFQVDRGGDENFNNPEPAFEHTRAHICMESHVHVATARCAGCSYLNRVELQNGQIQRAVSGLFIPIQIYTVNVHATDLEAEKKRVALLNANKQQEIYIERGQDAKFTTAKISFVPGARDPVAEARIQNAPLIRELLAGTQTPGSTKKPTKKEVERVQQIERENPDVVKEFREVRVPRP